MIKLEASPVFKEKKHTDDFSSFMDFPTDLPQLLLPLFFIEKPTHSVSTIHCC